MLTYNAKTRQWENNPEQESESHLTKDYKRLIEYVDHLATSGDYYSVRLLKDGTMQTRGHENWRDEWVDVNYVSNTSFNFGWESSSNNGKETKQNPVVHEHLWNEGKPFNAL